MACFRSKKMRIRRISGGSCAIAELAPDQKGENENAWDYCSHDYNPFGKPPSK